MAATRRPAIRRGPDVRWRAPSLIGLHPGTRPRVSSSLGRRRFAIAGAVGDRGRIGDRRGRRLEWGSGEPRRRAAGGGRLAETLAGVELDRLLAVRRRDHHLAVVDDDAVLLGIDVDLECGPLDAQAEQRRVDPDIPAPAGFNVHENAPALVT